MEIKVGDYVRTKCGIEKIERIIPNNYDKEHDYIELENCVFDGSDIQGFFTTDEIINSSPNIIDLIEVGDYINGWRVNMVEKEENGTLLTIGTITSFVSRNEKEPYLTQDYKEADKMCKIKSIVTKEQFEQMQYKVGE